ncbi:nuclear/nucleolar GTPase 2-like [Mercurialis annua]|uniref:nuclear/nucleolar GTPase 2-like n=1 Tax=Mercurialis annua TaxID=3986 RepID=UPI00216083D3|nr:nuclear/nucleolar GTPase 2-like [Mercurialis annua]
MGKKKTEKKRSVSMKPKHSLDTNRFNAKTNKNNKRSAATVRRLKMYNSKAKRNSRGKIIKYELQSKNLPDTRIQPDRGWFGNSRVVDQKKLEFFREEIEKEMSNKYNVIVNKNKVFFSLIK